MRLTELRAGELAAMVKAGCGAGAEIANETLTAREAVSKVGAGGSTLHSEILAAAEAGAAEGRPLASGAAETRACHLARTSKWLAETDPTLPVPPSLAALLSTVGTPAQLRYALWKRTLGVAEMPTLSAQAAQARRRPLVVSRHSAQSASEFMLHPSLFDQDVPLRPHSLSVRSCSWGRVSGARSAR